MAWATYNDFRVAVQLMIDGDEVSSVIQPATIDTMIGLGEGLVYLGADNLPPLRASSMLVDWADVPSNGNVVADNAVALPSGCLELDAAWFDPTKPLEIVSETEIRPWLNGGGTTRLCALAGDSLIFAAPASDGDELLGRYYARPAALKDGLHATFNRYPELFLYAALVASAPFLGFSAKIPVWQGFYSRLLAQANHTERMRAYAGGRLRVKAR
jgi:hypothetical protein